MRKPDKVTHDLVWTDKDVSFPYSEIEYAGKKYRFSNVNRPTRKRIDSFLTKEPATMAWIESFSKDDVYYDVGGNIGMYVVYAAVTTGCRVYAFEPESLNYAELNKNIHLNGLDKRVRAYCCGISDKGGFFDLFLSRFVVGFSHHDCGENRWEGPVTKLNTGPEARPIQGCMALRLDDLRDVDLLPPTHIKIDVDGLESKVIAGATNTLDNVHLKTVLVETDFKLPASVAIMNKMLNAGWRYSIDQVCMTRDEGKISPALWKHRLDNKIGGCNIIYYRDPAYDRVFAEATY